MEAIAERDPEFFKSTLMSSKQSQTTDPIFLQAAMAAYEKDLEETAKQIDALKEHSKRWHERTVNHRKLLVASADRSLRKKVARNLGICSDIHTLLHSLLRPPPSQRNHFLFAAVLF